jgi:hypothetical protein
MAIGTLHDRAAFLGNLAELVPWGGAQQWLLQTVVLREARRLLPPKASIVVAALLFALVHVPNAFLMSMTFVGALGWCAIYSRYPNIVPLGLSHAVATLALLYAFDDDITGRLRIGQSYLRLARDPVWGYNRHLFRPARFDRGGCRDSSVRLSINGLLSA